MWRSGDTESRFTGSTRDPRAELGTVLVATRNTSLYPDQLSLFACLLSRFAPVTDQSETKAMAGTMALTWYY